MKKAAIVVAPFFRNNNLFSRTDPVFTRDDCLYSFYMLREELLKAGIELNTQDITPPESAGLVIFNDMPKSIPAKRPGQKFFLLALESIAIHPGNFDTGRYNQFDKVFTWYDPLIDGSKVIKINYSFLFKTDFPMDTKGKEKLLCLIAFNKRSRRAGELYSERRRAINWFECNHPEDFDLFGQGWDQLFAGTIAGSVIRRLGLQPLFRRKTHQCCRGIVSHKLPVLSRYRFSICYENVQNIPGYITEKIFDSFFSGCVPVYLGADNICEHIPKECFIDKRDYPDYQALYERLKGMGDEEYIGYLQRIKEFLTSDRSYPFTTECFARTVVNGMING